MATHISHSVEQTEAIADELARSAPSGLVVGLSGDLGAGKTQFVRGFARGLGVTERIHSPTFELMHLYASGRMPLFHLDLYRLNTDEEIIAAGLTEYFEPQGFTIIEWIERWRGRPPAQFLKIQIETLTETTRRIMIYDRTGA